MHETNISNNAPFCNRTVHACAYFCHKMVHCGIWDWCIVGCLRHLSCKGWLHTTHYVMQMPIISTAPSCVQLVPGDTWCSPEISTSCRCQPLSQGGCGASKFADTATLKTTYDDAMMRTHSALLVLSHGNPPVTGGFSLKMDSNVGLRCFLWCQPEWTVRLTVILHVMTVMWRHYDAKGKHRRNKQRSKSNRDQSSAQITQNKFFWTHLFW